jgi:hypothetical protein
MLKRALAPQLTAGLANELQENGITSLHFEDSLQLAAGNFNIEVFSLHFCGLSFCGSTFDVLVLLEQQTLVPNECLPVTSPGRRWPGEIPPCIVR